MKESTPAVRGGGADPCPTSHITPDDGGTGGGRISGSKNTGLNKTANEPTLKTREEGGLI